ncbi:unnamed protein product [Penicillium discolor]
MRNQYIFRTPFLSPAEIKLGNLIPNIADPELDTRDCDLSLVLNKDYTVKPISDFRAFFQTKHNTQLTASLSRILRASAVQGSADNSSLDSAKGNIHTLRQPKAFFQQLCQDDAVRAWLQEQIEDGLDVHFVVGEVLGTPGVDVQVAGENTAENRSGQTYLAPGEQIFALRVKKLVFKTFRSKTVDTAKLEKHTTWQMVCATRSAKKPKQEWLEVSLQGMDDDSKAEEEIDDVEHFHDDEVLVLDVEG